MSRRLDHIDGLRGLAALLVLYQHLAEYCAAAAGPGSFSRAQLDWLFTWCDLGKVGVVAFFAISGFVVPYSFGGGGRPRAVFALSRFFRLYPAYWLSLGLAVVLLPALGAAHFGSAQVLANLTMAQILLGQKDVLGVYWTLTIELIFYASCVAVFSLGRLRSPGCLALVGSALVALALGGAVARWAGHGSVPVSLPLYLAVMWFGALVRLAMLERVVHADRRAALLLGLLLVAIPVVWTTAFDDHSHKQSVLADITAFYAGLALFLVCVKWRAFRGGTLVYLGAISYSVYLFHPVALELARAVAAQLPGAPEGLVQILLTLAVTLPLAHAVHRWVETPFVRLGKRIAGRLGGAGRQPTVAVAAMTAGVPAAELQQRWRA